MEQERKERIAQATRAYDEAFQEVHDEYTRKDRSTEQMLQKMRRMVQADHHLQHMRYPLRYVRKEEGIEIRRLDFNQPQEIRKAPYDVAMLRVSPFPLQDMYVREGEEKKEDAEAKASSPLLSKVRSLAEEKGMLFIEDAQTNENGFMAMDWPVQIRLQTMVYHCAKQALAAEQAKTYGDDEGFRRIMDAETPAEVSYGKEDAKQATEEDWEMTTRKKMYDIQEAKFRQYPELQSRLLSTGEAILAAYLPRDNLLGIGISTDDVRSKNPIHWRGKNLLGTVLMELRKQFREEQEKKAKDETPSSSNAPSSSARFTRMRRPRFVVPSASSSLVPAQPPSSLVPAQPVSSLVPAQPVSTLVPAQPVSSLVPAQPPSSLVPAQPSSSLAP
jgi:ribA/ribD-fused uncharacterized protein